MDLALSWLSWDEGALSAAVHMAVTTRGDGEKAYLASRLWAL